MDEYTEYRIKHLGKCVFVFLLTFILGFGIYLFNYFVNVAEWGNVLMLILFALNIIYGIYLSLDYIDKYEEDLALPVVILIIYILALLIVIALIIIFAIAMAMSMKENSKNG